MSSFDVRSIVPLAALLEVDVESASPEEVRGSMAWAAERCTAAGVIHGGALMSLADTLGAVCAFLNLPPDSTTSTVESKTNFFRAVRGGVVDGVSRPLHAGRTFIVVQTDLSNEGKPVAHVVQTQAVLATAGGE